MVQQTPYQQYQDTVYPNLPQFTPIYPLPGKTTSIHTVYPIVYLKIYQVITQFYLVITFTLTQMGLEEGKG